MSQKILSKKIKKFTVEAFYEIRMTHSFQSVTRNRNLLKPIVWSKRELKELYKMMSRSLTAVTYNCDSDFKLFKNTFLLQALENSNTQQARTIKTVPLRKSVKDLRIAIF